MNYFDDRAFTDKAHKLATKIIYPKLKLTETDANDAELTEIMDMKKGVDYIGIKQDGNKVYIQERFRRYSQNSFTLRYKRENSKEEVEQFSEFYKIKQTARYFKGGILLIYGIVSLNRDDLPCYAVINLKMFFEKVKNGEILIDESQKGNSKIENGKLIGATFKNSDGSSSMIFFDFEHIHKLFPKMIILSKGFKTDDNSKIGLITDKQLKYIKDLAKISVPSAELLTKQEACKYIDFLLNNKNDEETRTKYLKENKFRFDPTKVKTTK